MQLSGVGGGAKAHKTSFHAMANIAKSEGPAALYKGYASPRMSKWPKILYY
jgi:hypothetical protein